MNRLKLCKSCDEQTPEGRNKSDRRVHSDYSWFKVNDLHFKRGCERLWRSRGAGYCFSCEAFAFGVRSFAFQVFEQVFPTELCVWMCFGQLWRA